MGGEKTALVLSAGGLYCAWQAGAYKAIAEHMQPDLVVGASAGALNGWPIAGGCSPDSLIERWLDPDVSDVLHRHPRWTQGYFDPTLLRVQTEKIVAEFQPLIPFGLTLVELPRLRTVLFQHPHITARHLQATCAIPMVLPPVNIDGTRYVDGGLIQKLPFRGAIQMGATRIIALDCLLPPGLGWLGLLKPKQPLPSQLEIITMSPSEPLGDINSAILWNRQNIERWIALGYRDAQERMRQSESLPYDQGDADTRPRLPNPSSTIV